MLSGAGAGGPRAATLERGPLLGDEVREGEGPPKPARMLFCLRPSLPTTRHLSTA